MSHYDVTQMSVKYSLKSYWHIIINSFNTNFPVMWICHEQNICQLAIDKKSRRRRCLKTKCCVQKYKVHHWTIQNAGHQLRIIENVREFWCFIKKMYRLGLTNIGWILFGWEWLNVRQSNVIHLAETLMKNCGNVQLAWNCRYFFRFTYEALNK